MAKTNRNQHYIAQCYLRNFTEPLFTGRLCVYEYKKRRWESGRTTEGVGWHPYLCSTLDKEGKWDDTFDRLLKVHVEDLAAPALRKLAQDKPLDDSERSAVALFMALTAYRSPQMMAQTMSEYLDRLAPDDRKKWDEAAETRQQEINKSLGSRLNQEYLKPELFSGINEAAPNLQKWLLKHRWHTIRTTTERPFITSDWPVFAQRTKVVRQRTKVVRQRTVLPLLGAAAGENGPEARYQFP
jgi:hypothetical protein